MKARFDNWANREAAYSAEIRARMERYERERDELSQMITAQDWENRY